MRTTHHQVSGYEDKANKILIIDRVRSQISPHLLSQIWVQLRLQMGLQDIPPIQADQIQTMVWSQIRALGDKS